MMMIRKRQDHRLYFKLHTGYRARAFFPLHPDSSHFVSEDVAPRRGIRQCQRHGVEVEAYVWPWQQPRNAFGLVSRHDKSGRGAPTGGY